jgi:hypothetical protein
MLAQNSKLQLIYSDKDSVISKSETHGGFDNDVSSMNRILEKVLDKKPQRPFLKEDLEY